MLLACLLLATEVEQARLVFAERYDLAIAEAKARNVPVLVLDFDGWAESTHKIDSFFEDDSFLEAADGAVLVLASQEEHGSKKQVVDGVEREVCQRFGGTSCRVHRDMLQRVFIDFGKEGKLVSPLFGVMLPGGKVAAHLEHEHGPSEIGRVLSEAGKELGPGLRRSDYLRMQRGLKELEGHLERKDLAAAVLLTAELKKIQGDFAPQRTLAAEIEKLDAAGRKQIERGEELWGSGRHGEALLAVDDVKAAFGKLPVGAAATSKLTVWEKAPEAKPHLAVLKSERAARVLYQQALELERKGDRKRARQTLERVTKGYPDTQIAGRARALIATLDAQG